MDELTALAARFTRLERQNRRLRSTLMAALLCFACIFLMGQSNNAGKGGVLEGSELILRNQNGEKILELSGLKDHPLQAFHPDSETPYFVPEKNILWLRDNTSNSGVLMIAENGGFLGTFRDSDPFTKDIRFSGTYSIEKGSVLTMLDDSAESDPPTSIHLSTGPESNLPRHGNIAKDLRFVGPHLILCRSDGIFNAILGNGKE